MFGLSTIKSMNKRAAAQMKKSGLCAKDPSAPKYEARKVKEFEQESLSQVPPTPREANDFIVTSLGPNGGLRVTPTNKGAKSFLKKLFVFSEDYRGGSVVIKHRSWPSILWLIQADGMTASRK